MKDSEFIELLNLYLDHEISAADAARLEAEVQNNPARRKVYEQYCRMQKACKVLAADFTADEAVAAREERKVVPFNAASAAAARQRRMGSFYTIGTFAAAAACVAIIFVGRNRQAQAEQATTLARQAPAPIEATVATGTSAANRPMVIASAPAAAPRVVAPREAAHTLVSDSLLLTGKTHTEALMAAALQQQAEAQFAWISNLQLAPIQQPAPLSELRFESASAGLRPEGRALGNRAQSSNVNANVELTAFQFVK